jgi:hypothetical protein
MLDFLFFNKSTVICESVPLWHPPHVSSGKRLIVFIQGLFSAREELQGVVKLGNPDFYAPRVLSQRARQPEHGSRYPHTTAAIGQEQSIAVDESGRLAGKVSGVP